MVCMLNVPSSITIHDLLQFTSPCYQGINYLRVIRDNAPSQYMVLIQFKSQVCLICCVSNSNLLNSS